MKKKGFTLVELLAVIAILAILVIIALPNIMSLFNQSKQNSFENELKNIYKTAEQEWMKDSMFDTQNIVYARCKSEECTKELSLSGREEIEYYIEIDKGGNIIKYYSTDGSYQYEYNGTGLKIEEIVGSKQVANLQSKDVLSVICTGAFKDGKDVTNVGPTLYNIMAKQSFLDNVNSEFVTSSSGINFNAISSDTNGKGIYKLASTKDDPYPIYYYRGAVTNNNVKFAGFCWKAVRTTNTGGVKLIYNGTPDASGHCTNTTGTNTQIKESAFNSNRNSPAYVGYMYGTTNGTSTGEPFTYDYKYLSDSAAYTYKSGTSVTYSGGTYTLSNAEYGINSNHHYTCFSTSETCTTVYYIYFKRTVSFPPSYHYITISGVDPNGRELIDVVKDNMFSNHRDSIAKIEIENWYRDNMTSYTSKIEDTVYCNDRSISKEAGWSPTGNLEAFANFSGSTRALNISNPSLTCERKNDKFTVSSSIGNGKLEYPVGLLTVDEIVLAGGGGYYDDNRSYYLYTNQYYWSGSPGSPGIYDSGVIGVTDTDIAEGVVNYTYGLRPVVSLSPTSSVKSGDGTANNPYVIE